MFRHACGNWSKFSTAIIYFSARNNNHSQCFQIWVQNNKMFSPALRPIFFSLFDFSMSSQINSITYISFIFVCPCFYIVFFCKYETILNLTLLFCIFYTYNLIWFDPVCTYSTNLKKKNWNIIAYYVLISELGLID